MADEELNNKIFLAFLLSVVANQVKTANYFIERNEQLRILIGNIEQTFEQQ